MKIGIMGDSHDNLDLMRKAVSLFNRENVDHVFHTGDVVSPFAAKLLGELRCQYTVTFGNNDGERLTLKETITSSGGRLLWPLAVLKADDRKIALLHGEDLEIVSALGRSGEFSLVAYGHWHEPTIRIEGRTTLIVNPGETCGYLTGRPTVAIADLEKMQATLFDL